MSRQSIRACSDSKLTSPLQEVPTEPTNQRPQRQAAMWTLEEDERLIQARVEGLSWEPISQKYFPTKSANACRKRHERLMERRSHDDWDHTRLEALATAYMECRKEMWSLVAERMKERWTTVEAKVSVIHGVQHTDLTKMQCFDKGMKNLQGLARTSNKRKACELDSERGKEDHEGDSGVGLSDAEGEVGRASGQSVSPTDERPPSSFERTYRVPSLAHIPLYQPPASATISRQPFSPLPPYLSSHELPPIHQRSHSAGPYVQRGGLSIASMLLPVEPQSQQI